MNTKTLFAFLLLSLQGQLFSRITQEDLTLLRTIYRMENTILSLTQQIDAKTNELRATEQYITTARNEIDRLERDLIDNPGWMRAKKIRDKTRQELNDYALVSSKLKDELSNLTRQKKEIEQELEKENAKVPAT